MGERKGKERLQNPNYFVNELISPALPACSTHCHSDANDLFTINLIRNTFNGKDDGLGVRYLVQPRTRFSENTLFITHLRKVYDRGEPAVGYR